MLSSPCAARGTRRARAATWWCGCRSATAVRRAVTHAEAEAILKRALAIQEAFAKIQAKRNRLNSLREQQTALVVPPKPEIEIDPIDAEYVAVKNANVREEPTVRAAKVTTLKRGAKVHVAGKVKGKNWFLVEHDAKPLGYVYGELLKDAETVRQEEETRRKEAQRKPAEETKTAKSRNNLAALASLARTAASGQDTDTMETRLIAARRYAGTVDYPTLMQDLIAQMERTVPPNKRNAFRLLVMRSFEGGWIEDLTIESSVQVFTTNELNKLADFYGSPEGKSVIRKFPKYMANSMLKLTNRVRNIAKDFNLSTSQVPGRSSIIADNAFEVFGKAGVGTGSNDGITDMGVGDPTNPDSPGRRGVARFSLAGLAGQTLQSATLNLTILQSRRNDTGGTGNPCVGPITDNAAPFANPGLGDTDVIHIADPGTPDATDYQSASIGNDPGTLIAAGVDPPSLVSIDVGDAMQDAIDNGASFVAFRIQTATETDSDGCNDVWFIATEEAVAAATRPFLAYSTAPPKASASTSPQYGAIAIQNLLTALGYDLGAVDGLAGPKTQAAIRKYQAEHSLRATGKMSGELLIHLSETARRRLLR